MVGVRDGHRTSSHPSAVLSALALIVTLVATVLLVRGVLPAADTSVDGSPALPPERVAESLTFDTLLLADVAAYRGPRRIVGVLLLVTSVAVPAGMALAFARGRARRILGMVAPLPGPALRTAAAAMVVVLVTAAATAPLTVWARVVQDGRYGFRTRSVPGWLADHLAVVAGRALGVGALAWLIVAMARRWPRDWPARTTLAVAAVGVMVLALHPIVAHGLLLPTGPLPDGPHRDAVLELLERSEVDPPVLLGEASRRTTRRNAVATGLGPTERVVVHDTMLDLDPRLVAAVVAHELAHIERRDPLRAALAPVPVVALIGLIVQRRLRRTGLTDVRPLAAAAALVLALEAAATPLVAAASRTVELRTDVRSVVISGDREAHVELLRTFVVDGLADPDPPRWSVLLWGTHPSTTERIVAVSGAVRPATR